MSGDPIRALLQLAVNLLSPGTREQETCGEIITALVVCVILGIVLFLIGLALVIHFFGLGQAIVLLAALISAFADQGTPAARREVARK